MRNVSLAVRVIAIIAVFSVSAVGQQPAVLLYPTTSIDLAVEPARLPSMMTLADAARHNNFPAFDALFASASMRDASGFRELHSFWKWSLTDPVGAFYGDEMHAKLAGEYPDYADYIADFGIVDSHGRAYYPSAETRSFLLKKAESGRTALIADATPKVVRAPKQIVVRETPAPVVQKQPAKIAKQTSKPLHEARPAATAVRTVEAPVVVPKAKPIFVTKVVRPPVATTAAVVAPPKPKPVAVQVTPATDARLGRGLMLIIAGLIALGMVSLMFSTPAEEEPARQNASHVEPMRIIPLDEKPKKTA